MTEVLYLPYERLLLAVLTGVLCGVFYELLRTVRLIVSEKNRLVNFVTDMAFFVAMSFVIFFFSMLLGDGRIRFYYFAGMFAGVGLYLFTVGKLIYLINRSFVRLLKKVLRKLATNVFKPIARFFVAVAHKIALLFGKSYDFSVAHTKNAFKYLKFNRRSVYNKKVPIGNEEIEGSESKHAVKGRVKPSQG